MERPSGRNRRRHTRFDRRFGTDSSLRMGAPGNRRPPARRAAAGPDGRGSLEHPLLRPVPSTPCSPYNSVGRSRVEKETR